MLGLEITPKEQSLSPWSGSHRPEGSLETLSPSAFILTRNSNPSMADRMPVHSCDVTGLSSELLRILRQEDCMSKAYRSEFKAGFKVKKKAGL